MSPNRAKPSAYVTMGIEGLQKLLQLLQARDYKLLGPTVRNNNLLYDEISSTEDLPAGVVVEQEAGVFSLKRTNSPAFFAHSVGQHSWKQFLYPPHARLWSAQRKGSGFAITVDREDPPAKYAFIGVRACELSAIAIQDRVFMQGRQPEPIYQRRRENTFIVAVNCAQPSKTCFCASMRTGPLAKTGYDIAITEVIEQPRHYFVADAGTERAREILGEIPTTPTSDGERAAAEKICAEAQSKMGRTLDTTGIKELLYANYEHPEWEAVAERCLGCTNCTLVCPTCFCHTIEDYTDLSGNTAERFRKWDSCFVADHSYIHGGSVRATNMSRYRQWLTHKLATWIDQFGTSGCVGCGRCITWCPVGIDITEEVNAIRTNTVITKEASYGLAREHAR